MRYLWSLIRLNQVQRANQVIVLYQQVQMEEAEEQVEDVPGGEAAPAEEEGAEVSARAAERAALLQKYAEKSKNYWKCANCAGNPVKQKTHFCDRKRQKLSHTKMDHTKEELQEWRLSWALGEVDKELGGEEMRKAMVQEEVARVRSAKDTAIPPLRIEGGSGQQWEITGPSKYRGMTIQRVLRQYPDYFARLVQQTPAGHEALENRHAMKENLQLAGVWQQTLDRAHELALKDAGKTIVAEETGASQSYHPAVRQLHDINLGRARALLSRPEGAIVAAPAAPSKPQPKSRASRAMVASKARKFTKNCLLCGKHGCVTSKCPLRTRLDFLEQEHKKLVGQEQLSPEEKRRRKLIAHLKYVNIKQRSREYEERSRSARVPVARSFSRLHRASPGVLVGMLTEDGLLQNLSGMRCVNPRCKAIGATGFSLADDGVLGALRCASKNVHETVTVDSVFYRCIWCSIEEG